ncbi:MAG: hypothetical protein JW804_03270 [Sedimentisphaerales bacterium]|nr:hypothetical protein [Sedimentisphaerales bacterium]
MKYEKKTVHKGVTLIELVITAAAAAIIIIGIGTILFYTHENYNKTFDRVHGEVTSGEYVAKRAFESVVRKSSVSEMQPVLGTNNESLKLYYYSSPTATALDSFTRFYTINRQLLAVHGTISGNSEQAQRIEEIVSSVTSAKFSVLGANAQMVLTLDDGQRTKTLICSAARHSR